MSEDKEIQVEIDEKKSEVLLETPEKEGEQNETATRESAETEVAPTAEEFAHLKAEYEARFDQMLRTVAEYENSKKRAIREKEEFLKYASEGFIKDLIPVVDSIERAIKSTKESKDFDALSEGIQLIHKQLLDLLGRRGVTQIEAVRETFDPNQHEAIMHIESDEVPENAVIEEFQRGYLLHSRVIRPSLVSVSKGKGEKEESSSAPDEQTDTLSDADANGKEKTESNE